MANRPLLIEIWDFLKVRKAWWLLPTIILILLVGILITLQVATSGLSPIIYAMF